MEEDINKPSILTCLSLEQDQAHISRWSCRAGKREPEMDNKTHIYTHIHTHASYMEMHHIDLKVSRSEASGVAVDRENLQSSGGSLCGMI